MRTSPVQTSDWRGVFPVPPLARRRDARRTIDFAENDRVVKHLAAGGMTRFLYGGNAFLYHITLAEYEELLGAERVCGQLVGDSERGPLLRPADRPGTAAAALCFSGGDAPAERRSARCGGD